MGSVSAFLKIDRQLSFESLEQCITLQFGKNIFIKPIHRKFCGALSVIIPELNLCKSKNFK